MSRLDNLEYLASADPAGMGEWVAGLPEQCEEAFRLGQEAPLPEAAGVRQVVVVGMGGSAIGADLLRGYVEGEMAIPFLVSRTYHLPAFVSRETLVIASSYSGNTEETLSAYGEARERGARMFAIASGGELERRAQADGVPFCRIPGGYSPRAALGYSFVPLLAVLSRLGLIRDRAEDLAEAVKVMRELRAELGQGTPAADNPAKQLAERLYGKLPFIYGAAPWSSAVAYRWKGQVNENAKNLSHSNILPELNHNETVGWEFPERLTAQIEVVLLRDREDHPKVQRRFEVTSTIMRPHVSGITEVWSRGHSILARLFSLIYHGDFTSYYLALLNGVDPTPVKVIDYLKGELAKV
ncbi:MAG: bifunctional phosphoglucose/phosphomannose isomerase [Bacillota bacterium]|nr:bifunctional phosphoglucose/phosphomannose isomerase [Bacillota bacterium]